MSVKTKLAPTNAKAMLFQEYLKLQIHPDMCPSHIMWSEHRLQYRPITEDGTHAQFHGHGVHPEVDRLQRVLDLLDEEIENRSFSFMDYNSQDNIGLELAQKHPNATFISLLATADRVTESLQIVRSRNLTNVAVTVVDINTQLTSKLLTCPDFLRYQYLGYEEVLEQMKPNGTAEFDLLIGQIIATGVTTFIQVPSSKIVSLAATTFFPSEAHPGFAESQASDTRSLHFQAESHPYAEFRNLESRFLFDSAQTDVDIEVTARFLSPSLEFGSHLPWKLVRVDVKKLHVDVDHHFDYTLDGHRRKYRLHCNSLNTSTYNVYLVRSLDGFKIPYGTVNAISLIALLRMGLVSEIKNRFYSDFLSMPLYEDMAPWNIVFRAGRLEYIDYDSKDFTLTKMAPAAYQIMAMLMNYERTVKDLGHCQSEAKTEYGFSLVSKCIGSDFEGPCLDTRFPVPCGDYTCRPTYIDCLRALLELETTTHNAKHSGSKKKIGSRRVSEETGVMQWSFNIGGPNRPINKEG